MAHPTDTRTECAIGPLASALAAAVTLGACAAAHATPCAADGLFAPGVLYDAGDSPVSLAIGDLNGDGAPDFALAS